MPKNTKILHHSRQGQLVQVNPPLFRCRFITASSPPEDNSGSLTLKAAASASLPQRGVGGKPARDPGQPEFGRGESTHSIAEINAHPTRSSARRRRPGAQSNAVASAVIPVAEMQQVTSSTLTTGLADWPVLRRLTRLKTGRDKFIGIERPRSGGYAAGTLEIRLCRCAYPRAILHRNDCDRHLASKRIPARKSFWTTTQTARQFSCSSARLWKGLNILMDNFTGLAGFGVSKRHAKSVRFTARRFAFSSGKPSGWVTIRRR